MHDKILRWGDWRDPRHLQLAVLGGLLGYGICCLDFEVNAWDALLLLGTTLATEWVFARRLGRAFDPRSPLISGLSLCLLLRANEPVFLMLGAFIAVASKFLIRVGDKHIFNPTNLALVVLLFAGDGVWVSAGQWGSQALMAAAMACAGGMVLRRAERSDITVAFLVFWIGILFGRSAWLAEPWAIPMHRLASGGLLIFAFFMLSDPRTIPDSRPGRIVFAGLVALTAGAIQFLLYRPNGLLIALAVSAPLVPLLDIALPGRRFRWAARSAESLALPASSRLPSLTTTAAVLWRRPPRSLS